MSVDEALLADWVSSIIIEYDKKSTSKKLSYLTPNNINEITTLLKTNKYAMRQFISAISKRDKIQFQLSKLLNDLMYFEKDDLRPPKPVQEEGEGEGEGEGEDDNDNNNDKSDNRKHKSSRHNSIPKNSNQAALHKLDPTIINNRAIAESYITNVILIDPEKRKVIGEMIAKQDTIEIEWYEARKKLIVDFKPTPIRGPKVLGLIKNKKDEEQLKKELTAYDEKFYKVLEKFVSECFLKFKRLKIPFFCLRKEYSHYPELKDDRRFVLDVLTSLCVDPPENEDLDMVG